MRALITIYIFTRSRSSLLHLIKVPGKTGCKSSKMGIVSVATADDYTKLIG